MQMSLFSAGALLVLATGMAVGQEKFRKRAQAGPYRVVISKPLIGIGYTAGSLYTEHGYLGAMFNELSRDGLLPIMTNVMTQTLEGRESEQRLIVVCRKAKD